MEKKGSNQISLSMGQVVLMGGLSVVLGIGLSKLIDKISSKEEEVKSNGTAKNQFRADAKRKTTVTLQKEAIAARLKIEANMNKENTLISELKFLESQTCEIERIPHLISQLELTTVEDIVTPLLGNSKYRSVFGGEGFIPEEAFVLENSFVLQRHTFGPKVHISDAKKYLRGGPRKYLFWKSNEVSACIVTCGGLCPGLNVVIREVVNCLYYNYGVKKVYGIKFGYKGFYTYEWEELTPSACRKIHHQGGTILGSSRGGFDLDKITNSIIEHNVNQVYCIGGDGTHRGINALFEEITRRKLKIGIVGIPKTIDNDIAVIEKSFGFTTAVEEALRAIHSADVEANCAEYGVGLVKLMGRSAGFIAMMASLASRDVNICLVPEFPFELYGPRGLLDFIYRRLKHKKHCVIVVAEGAGDAVQDEQLTSQGTDASGNKKLSDIGSLLKKKIVEYGKEQGMDITLKYIDPTYMIRTVPANSVDQHICSQLAQNAVHGLMGGWTGFTIGTIGSKTCLIPLKEITHPPHPINIQPDDRAWQRLLASTGQPSFLNSEDKECDKLLEDAKEGEGDN